MNALLADLLQVLKLERLEIDLFRGQSRKLAGGRVFGGQVLGQALAAAYATIEGREAHSLHAYFLRAGDPDHPIVYEVDRSRDGRGFSSRRVVAIQHGEQIFHMSASFQIPEAAIDRQADMPEVPAPESVPDLATAVAEAKLKAPDRPSPFRIHEHPFEFRPAELPDPLADVPREPRVKVWIRLVERVPDDPILHRCLLAYTSDYFLLGAASMDARMSSEREQLQMASIDHAMWFHRPARPDEWLLYVLDSPTASGARGFARGSLFTRDGRLVASTAQEGLVRRLSS
ncbi:acyl-CoA thioesterase II [Steroidobacter agaridevorans]|uniref:Acyl-CoA thioesterase 2 n=1 Tax=Steroidobacter agaridevorans TaxID=2695856 RepID=A0A829Y7S8_9GAMM|nr:acyl-CoA thioesterase II [Steroidobacter agaridevorans]GFE79319.1 acyl-CoA thioesterase II [Steroidobacter agaridevorans]GFE88324.1 acyl-CoA thioesterase II [Steroidobacter agaridevorans]